MKYLVTGSPGSGKSSVAESLITRGVLAIDTDRQPYSHWLEHSTGLTYASRPRKTPNWREYFEWVWNENEIQKVLDNNISQDIFLCGLASNQIRFYPIFSRIFFLDLDSDRIKQRLATRTNNPFGSRPGDIEVALGSVHKLKGLLERPNVVRIDASQPLHKVADEILSYLDES